MATLYGYTIRYSPGAEKGNPFGGEASVSNCLTPDDAMIKCIRMCLKSGWHPPQWWQFWRWGDTNPPAEAVERARRLEFGPY